MAEAKPKRGAGAEKPAPKRKPPKRKQVEETARRYFAAMQARDPQAMAACWSEDGVEDLVPLRVLRGPEEISAFFAGLFAAMPDAETTVHNVVAGERQAAVEWRTVGTFTGEPLQGVQATGGRLELRGLDLLEIAEDRILNSTAYYDGAGLMRQLGLLPPQDSGPEKAIKTAFNTVNKLRRTVTERRAAR
ncbi:MAG: ester cyclase [Actinomycetota bacterium]|nr:ester cyclase [Actinomycetota bacterium]